MKDAAAIQRLERVYAILSRSFIRYVADAAQPRILDEWDRRAMEEFRIWRVGDLALLDRMEDLFERERVHPQPGSWPVDFSQYNYLRASSLLKTVIRKMEREVDLLESEAGAPRDWPEAVELITRAAESARSRLKALQDLEEERPKHPPPPGEIKGVSASRW